MARVFTHIDNLPGEHQYAWFIDASGKALCLDLFDSRLVDSAFTAEELEKHSRKGPRSFREV